VRTLRLSVALVLLAACGAPGGTGIEHGGVVSSGPLPRPTGAPATAPNEARPDTRIVELRPRRWSRAEAGAGRELRLHYSVTGHPECQALGRVDVLETAGTVTVTLLVGHLPGAACDGPQPQLAAPFTTVVTLREPLGHRQVVDGAPS